jgi:hypothetical protein
MEERRELGSYATTKLGTEAYASVSPSKVYVRRNKKEKVRYSTT